MGPNDKEETMDEIENETEDDVEDRSSPEIFEEEIDQAIYGDD